MSCRAAHVGPLGLIHERASCHVTGANCPLEQHGRYCKWGGLRVELWTSWSTVPLKLTGHRTPFEPRFEKECWLLHGPCNA